MKFQIGDQVVHPVHGVGTITTFSNQRFVGDIARSYYQVKNQRVTVWVPVDDQGLSVLRGIASKDSLKDCRRLLKSPAVALVKNRQVRQHDTVQPMENKSLPALCKIVRDLRAVSRQKPLGSTDSELLHKTSQALCDEWAAAEGVTSQFALAEIEALLQSKSPSQLSAIRD